MGYSQDDNCPMVANPLQEDEDDNNEGDVCVSRSDGELLCLPLVSENGNVSVVCL